MKKEYEIVLENGKYNIYYYINDELETKEFHSVDSINGEIKDGYNKKGFTPPNWFSLEQTLRYSALFQKAFTLSSDKGFSLFMTTLINGKSGTASEKALTYAFSVLGVEWTDEEKTELNKILTDNNFTIQL